MPTPYVALSVLFRVAVATPGSRRAGDRRRWRHCAVSNNYRSNIKFKYCTQSTLFNQILNAIKWVLSLWEYPQKSTTSGPAPDSTEGVYTAPRPSSWFQGGFTAVRRWEGGENAREMRKKRKGRWKGNSIAPWLLGDRRSCPYTYYIVCHVEG